MRVLLQTNDHDAVGSRYGVALTVVRAAYLCAQPRFAHLQGEHRTRLRPFC